jgi:hypothetical protein
MPKYSQYMSTADYEAKKRKTTQHPIWRGIGFIIMILIPLAAYFLAVFLLNLNEVNGWMKVPQEFLAKSGDTLLYVKIGMTVVLSIIVYGIMMLFGFAGLSVFGSSRYGEMDEPPVKSTGGRKRWE